MTINENNEDNGNNAEQFIHDTYYRELRKLLDSLFDSMTGNTDDNADDHVTAAHEGNSSTVKGNTMGFAAGR